MRKFSKCGHHSLTEINITPLLDLCFVLLVIFIITTTPIVNDFDVNLPRATKQEKPPKPKVNHVTIDPSGQIALNRRPVDLAELSDLLVEMRTKDLDLNVVVRGDKHTKYKEVIRVLEVLQRANLFKVNLATEPASP